MAIELTASLFIAKTIFFIPSTTVEYALYTADDQQLIAGDGEPLEWQYDIILGLLSAKSVFPSAIGNLKPHLLTANVIFPRPHVTVSGIVKLQTFTPKSIFPPPQHNILLYPDIFTPAPVFPKIRIVPALIIPLFTARASFPLPAIQLIISATLFAPKSVFPSGRRLTNFIPTSVHYNAYFLVLTGANDATSDLDLSSRFKTFSLQTQVDGLTVLQISIAGATDIAGELAVRQNGELIVYKGYAYVVSKEKVHIEELGRVDFEYLEFQESSNNRTTILRGSSITEVRAPVTIEIELRDAIVKRISGGTNGLRTFPNDNLVAGDTVKCGTLEFVVGKINYTVSENSATMELTEAKP